jgi:hypothetical protein
MLVRSARFALLPLLWTAILAWNSGALAAGFFFNVVRTTPLDIHTDTNNSVCPDPCYQVQVFAQDSLGSTTTIRAVQFDVGIEGATPVNLPVPGLPNPQPSSNVLNGNVLISAADESFEPFLSPWEFDSRVGVPQIDFDLYARIIAATFTTPGHTAQSLLALRTDPNNLCTGSSCATQLEGLAAGRIFLGRFNVSAASAATTFTVAGIMGLGPLVNGVPGVPEVLPDGQVTYLGALNSPDQIPCRLGTTFNASAAIGSSAGSCLIDRLPEPTPVLLLAVTIAGLGLLCRVRHARTI